MYLYGLLQSAINLQKSTFKQQASLVPSKFVPYQDRLVVPRFLQFSLPQHLVKRIIPYCGISSLVIHVRSGTTGIRGN